MGLIGGGKRRGKGLKFWFFGMIFWLEFCVLLIFLTVPSHYIPSPPKKNPLSNLSPRPPTGHDKPPPTEKRSYSVALLKKVKNPHPPRPRNAPPGGSRPHQRRPRPLLPQRPQPPKKLAEEWGSQDGVGRLFSGRASAGMQHRRGLGLDVAEWWGDAEEGWDGKRGFAAGHR